MARPPALPGPTPTPSPRPCAPAPNGVSPADYLETCIASYQDAGDLKEMVSAEEVVSFFTSVKDVMRDAEL